MSFITREYTVLKKGDDEITIRPNTLFNMIPSGYVVTSHAIIFNNDTGELATVLKAGSVTQELKDIAKQDYSSFTAAELRELCIDRGLSFPSKATKARLTELLEGA